MEGILTVFVRVIIGLVLITILVGTLIGIPILLAAAAECVICFLCKTAFDWTVPIIIGVGTFIFICLAIADTKGGN